jgi:hypothetical protein
MASAIQENKVKNMEIHSQSIESRMCIFEDHRCGRNYLCCSLENPTYSRKCEPQYGEQ